MGVLARRARLKATRRRRLLLTHNEELDVTMTDGAYPSPSNTDPLYVPKGSVSSISAGTGYFLNSDGNYQEVPDDCPKIRGARVVANMLAYNSGWASSLTSSESLAGWTAAANATIDSDNMTFNLTADANSRIKTPNYNNGYIGGRTFGWLAKLSGPEGAVVGLTISDGGPSYGATTKAITLSTTPKWYWVTHTADFGTAEVSFRVREQGLTAVSGIKMHAYMPIDLTWNSNTNPCEYISYGRLSAPYHGMNIDGVKCFSTKNANSVSSSGEVTFAVGRDLDTAPSGIQIEAGTTNVMARSEELSDWSNNWGSGVTLTSNAATGLENLLSMDKIAQIAGIGDGIQTSFNITASTTYTVTYTLKNGNATKSRLFIRDNNLGAKHAELVVTWTGAVPSTSSSYQASNIDYKHIRDDIYEISFSFTTPSTVTTFLTVIHPEYGVTATNHILVDHVQVEASSYPTTRVRTTGSTVTRVQDKANYLLSDELSNDFIVEFDFMVEDTPTGTTLFQAVDSASSSVLQVDVNSSGQVNISMIYSDSSTYSDTTSTSGFNDGSTHNFKLEHNHITGTKWYIDSSLIGSSSSTKDTKAMYKAAPGYVGANSGLACWIKNIKVYKDEQ